MWQQPVLQIYRILIGQSGLMVGASIQNGALHNLLGSRGLRPRVGLPSWEQKLVAF